MTRFLAGARIATSLAFVWIVGADDGRGNEKLDGYLEWRRQDVWIVDGQRVAVVPSTEFKGRDDASSPESTPLGYEVEADGTRSDDGVLQAKKIEVRANETSALEREVLDASDEVEQTYRETGQMFEVSSDEALLGLGALRETGPRCERARRIVDRLMPPYLAETDVRVYVVDNPEWNAMALGNFSIYVFSGLIDVTDDDELALVLGHELAHASYEHSRRQEQEKRSIAARAQMGGRRSQDTELIFFELDAHDRRNEARAKLRSYLMALSNRFNQKLEDQADRVGLRYAHEAGYDVSKGPRLWERFGERYGDTTAILNFFLGSHPRWVDRAEDLRQELALNYN